MKRSNSNAWHSLDGGSSNYQLCQRRYFERILIPYANQFPNKAIFTIYNHFLMKKAFLELVEE